MANLTTSASSWNGSVTQNSKSKTYTFETGNKFVDKNVALTVNLKEPTVKSGQFDGINETMFSIPEGFHDGTGSVSLTDDIPNELDLQSDLMDEILELLKTKKAGGGGLTPKYELGETVFDGTQECVIDTGINLFEKNEDFVIYADFIATGAGDVASLWNHKVYGSKQYLKLVRPDGYDDFGFMVNGQGYKPLDLAGNKYRWLNTRHKLIIRRVGNTFSYTLDGFEFGYPFNEYGGETIADSLVIGGHKDYNKTTYNEIFNGTIFEFKLYLNTLSDGECADIIATIDADKILLNNKVRTARHETIEGTYRDNQAIADLIFSGKVSVTSIASNQFQNNEHITDAIFPNVTAINGYYAFDNCPNLEYAEFPNCTSFGQYIFYRCYRLKKVVVPKLTSGFPTAFLRECKSLEELVCDSKETIISFGSYAFAGTKLDLSFINFTGITSLQDGVFGGVTGLPRYLNFASLRTMANYVFQQVPVGGDVIDIGPSITSMGGNGILYPSNEVVIIRALSVPTWNGVNTAVHPNIKIYVPNDLIATYQEATNWVRFADKFLPLEGSVFEDNLTVTTVADNRFKNREDIEYAYFPVATSLGSYSFNHSSLVEIDAPNVTFMGGEALSGCANLKKVNLPNLTNMQGNFGGTAIESISLPKVTHLANSAFFNCSQLVDVDLPSLTNLSSSYAFYGCSSLEVLKLPSLTNINCVYAFNNCTNLRAIVLSNPDAVCTLSEGAGAILPATGRYVYVPQALLDQYREATNWAKYADRILPIEGSEYE